MCVVDLWMTKRPIAWRFVKVYGENKVKVQLITGKNWHNIAIGVQQPSDRWCLYT